MYVIVFIEACKCIQVDWFLRSEAYQRVLIC